MKMKKRNKTKIDSKQKCIQFWKIWFESFLPSLISRNSNDDPDTWNDWYFEKRDWLPSKLSNKSKKNNDLCNSTLNYRKRNNTNLQSGDKCNSQEYENLNKSELVRCRNKLITTKTNKRSSKKKEITWEW